ncbi:hypothetical protein GCM10012288_24910 [Malaciobacter pacificus]|uniref:Uncharacterized protein n=1 Tax=Malaciobacter pacificus TaxID=1080223 RepID=A0A5C2HD38_9BACT|nr:hypothetical protein [Malaciobacter pacificus]QEP35046.1 hypothetical protein APAC_1974 [Malaciobacter pacificus]GGD49894.1 hypothetical protein GCM10012288_24910 [Malaciobacter pacificus]
MNSLKLAEKFNKKAPANQKKSKLDQHNEAIKYLLDNNHSLLSIQNFLENECKCKVAYSTLRDYCNRRFNNKSESEIAAKKYEEIKLHCANLIKKYFDEEEKNKTKSIIEVINFFVKKSVNKSLQNTTVINNPSTNISNETDDTNTVSDFVKIMNQNKNKTFG